MGFPCWVKKMMGFGFRMCYTKMGFQFSLKVKFRERDLWHLAEEEAEGSVDFGVDFKSSHHFVVCTNVLEPLPLVFYEFLRRRYRSVEREREREREILFGIYIYIYMEMLTDILRSMVNNPFKESFYRKRKK